MSISAVIPVRAGSTRIKNKNIKPFAGTNLLENKILQLQRVEKITQIIVSSDSDEMLSIAKKYGAVPMKRPDEYCDERTKSFNEVVEYIAREQVKTDIMMWAPCVCPLISSEKITEGISLFERILSGEVEGDSVVTASLLKEYIFDEKGPVNFDIEHHVPSQRLPNWHIITNGFFVAKRRDMEKWKFVYGPKPVLCEVNKIEAIDIDDEIDFKIAEQLMLEFKRYKEMGL